MSPAMRKVGASNFFLCNDLMTFQTCFLEWVSAIKLLKWEFAASRKSVFDATMEAITSVFENWIAEAMPAIHNSSDDVKKELCI